MFKVSCEIEEKEFGSLELAMAYARKLNMFVTISGESFEVVGLFGVDSVVDGKCPDGIAYDWNKSSRTGQPRRR